MTEYTNEFMSGTIYWAKVFRAVDNYEKTGKEWAFDFVPDDDGVAVLKKHRLLDRLKEGVDPIDGDYLRLKKPTVNKDGDKNEPFKIYDAEDNVWDGGNIGNGSKVDLALTIADFGKGKKKAIWTQAIRVIEHVPHEGGTQDSNPFANKPSGVKAAPKKAVKPAKTEAPADFDDDEMPF